MSSDKAWVRCPIDCPLCRGATPTTEVARRGVNVIVRCGECGFIYVNPQPSMEELAAFYGPSYFSNNPDKFFKLPMPPAVARRLLDYVRLVKRHGQGGKLLDIGCGTGFFLLTCRDRGLDAEGVELSPVAAEFGRKEFGLRIATGTLADQDLPQHSFDVVTMWDCLEHTRDPLAELARVQQVLKPGGVLCVTVPNSASLWARLSGSRWMGYDKADEHLLYFTQKTLARALTASGLQPLVIRPQGWICEVEFVLQKGERIWRPGARLLRRVCSSCGLLHRTVRFPAANLFAAALRPGSLDVT